MSSSLAPRSPTCPKPVYAFSSSARAACSAARWSPNWRRATTSSRPARSAATIRIDIADPDSIVAGLKAAGTLDAVVCAAGAVNFAPLEPIPPAPIERSSYGLGLVNKLMGQVNLALAARDVLRDGGSITLIAGVLADEPIVAGSSASMVNGALESFVKRGGDRIAARASHQRGEPDGVRGIDGRLGPFFRGFDPVPVARAARAFSRSVEGRQTGQVYKVLCEGMSAR